MKVFHWLVGLVCYCHLAVRQNWSVFIEDFCIKNGRQAKHVKLWFYDDNFFIVGFKHL